MEWVDGLPADIGAMYRLQDQTTSVKPLRIEGHCVFPELRISRMLLELLDIKLDNVVLAPPLDGEFPSYPTPKLMDFGHVGEIYAGNPRSMADQCWGGTRGWKAPERLPDANPPGPMTQASDVYSVGPTVYHLMNLSRGGAPRLDPDGIPTFAEQDAGFGFSPTLKEVVRCMVQTNHAARPTFEYLHKFIAELFATPADQPEAMRIKALATVRLEDAERWIPDSELWRYELDYRQDMRYRLDTVCRFLEPDQPEEEPGEVPVKGEKAQVAGKGPVRKAASV
ncbi:hypothetical protein LTR95_004354 [Oleoguttula sp. CCFEE 5521]